MPERLVKGLEDLKIGGQEEANSIIKIGQNDEKSPGNLRTLDVTQYPVKNHQRTIV